MNLPKVTEIIRLDDFHLVLSMEVVRMEKIISFRTNIIEWEILGGIDKKFHIEELQGLPRIIWLPHFGMYLGIKK